LLALIAWTLWCLGAAVAAAPEAEPAEIPGVGLPDEIEDPRRLEDLGEAALASGDTDGAAARFREMLERREVTKYLSIPDELGEALVDEWLGRFDEAAAVYRAYTLQDPLRTVQVLRILSDHPDREALVTAAYDHVRALVAATERGEQAVIYVTSKGEPRYLEPLTLRQVLADARAGELSRYCYVPDLDLQALSELAGGALPEVIHLERCVVGRIWGPSLAFDKLVFKGFVLGDVDLGKTFAGEKNKSKTLQPSTFADLVFREAVFLGRANFAAIEVSPGRAYFPMAVFEGEADFKGAELRGVTEFRFASFGRGANFRFMRMYQPVYFGGTRFRADTMFANVYSERDVYFNEATFEAAASFGDCEFQRGATFENTRFHGTTSFATSRIVRRLNLSRAVFDGPVDVVEVELGALDALGTEFHEDALFTDATIHGRARFSLDDVTRRAAGDDISSEGPTLDIDGLLHLYRDYQGDEDADEPITSRSSYGVVTADDLTAVVDRNISFANTMFGGFTVFEGVTFGQPGAETVASFFNTQFLGETHFERTDFHARADFTTIFGKEIAFNGAVFRRSLVLDDAAVDGRVTLTDASFEGDADLSFYASEIASLQIDPDQVKGAGGSPHRLFYEACAYGRIDRDDARIRRMTDGGEVDDAALREQCYDYLLDEFVVLKGTYGDRAMTGAEDDAYWWLRHHETRKALHFGGFVERIEALVVRMMLFEWCFGWGVRLMNLAFAAAVITVVYAVLYRVVCPDTVLQYDGEDVKVRDVPFVGLCYVSLQALIAVNTGWDFGDDDHRFRMLNVSETVLGFIVLTFFVGAYTRMILA
jgi:uncharacterized protein YjbI with pentapeptide repeats